MTAPEIMVIPSSDACVNLYGWFTSAATDDGRQSGQADAQSALWPNPYPWMQPRGKFWCCFLCQMNTWCMIHCSPVPSSLCRSAKEFIVLTVLHTHQVSEPLCHPPFLWPRWENPILENDSDGRAGGGRPQNQHVVSRRFRSDLKAYLLNFLSTFTFKAWILKGYTVLCSALCLVLYLT